MRRTVAWRAALALVLVSGLVAAGTTGRGYVRGAALVVQAADIGGWPGRLAEWPNQDFAEEALEIPSRHSALRARLYRPSRALHRTVVVVPGVHAGGIDEPRLVGLARDMARLGTAVLTPELVDLTRYAVTPRSTDMIEDAALWTLGHRDLSPDGRVGLMGISFGGGLTLVAAGRPAIRNRVAFAFSFGGHGDLPRVLRYLCTGVLPDGTSHPPHDYGVAIILLGLATTMVPADQADALQHAILTFLNASHLAMVDKVRAEEEFDRARELQIKLGEPAASLMHLVNTRDVAALGQRLLPFLESMGQDPALSPARSVPPSAPVYLLHGTNDNVIPSVESTLLAERLEAVTEVQLLLTPLITHAELDRPPRLGEVWSLIAFWTDLLNE